MTIHSANILLFGISGGEILIILLAVLLLFGPSKIPEIARMIGRGINEVKKVQREINTEINRYTADIETEARSMQNDINKLTRDMDTSENALEDDSQDLELPVDEQGQENADEPADSNEELPYPYNQKTGGSI